MVAFGIENARARINSGLVTGAVTSAILASAGLGLSPTVNATCASFFGIGNSANCTSTLFGVALAIGDEASAHALGFFGASFAIGTAATATSSDAFGLAAATGDNVSAGRTGC